MTICIVGLTFSGKTALLRKLCHNQDPEPTAKLAPTVGISHYKMTITSVENKQNGRGKKNVNKEYQLQEIGGELAQNWTSYLQVATKLLFVIDCSDLNRLPEVSIHLLDCLEMLSKQSKPSHVLLVYSKCDLVREEDLKVRIRHIEHCIRLSHLEKWYRNLEIMQVSLSLYTERGIPEIKNWIKQNY